MEEEIDLFEGNEQGFTIDTGDNRANVEIDTSCIFPIWAKNGEAEEVVGTGFVVGKYLITAAHVRKEHPHGIYIQKEDSDKSTPLENLIFSEYENDERREIDEYAYYNRKDIAIFEVGDMGSAYEIYDGEVEDEATLWMYGFYFGDGCMRNKLSGKTSMCIPAEMNHWSKVLPAAMNCTWFISDRQVIGGNSGCPIMRGNKIYGMLLGGAIEKDLMFCTIHTAAFIRSVMEGIEGKGKEEGK